ncbi:MAG: aspartate dehydrogenase [Lachnospiraceae bacterium]|nr:aspartate dehydrogenase [Lachnospiraceae bacterium]
MFGKKKQVHHTYDAAAVKPVIHASICNGEQVAGFQDRKTGHFEGICLIKTPQDLERFKEEYGITEEIGKVY